MDVLAAKRQNIRPRVREGGAARPVFRDENVPAPVVVEDPADVRGLEMRRQRGDVGLINQRYVLLLFGNNQKVELQPWQAADEMTVSVPNVTWELNTWYRMKLRVQNRPDGTTLAQGKVWKRDQPEPAAWLVEKIDKIPHRSGAPGLYGDGISDVFFDNLKVYKNQ